MPLQRFIHSALQRSLQRPAEILEAVEPLLDHVDAGRVAQPNRAIVAESGARLTATLYLLSSRSAKFCELSDVRLMFTRA